MSYIGANGSGKSNLISFFKMLNWMVVSPGDLQFYVGKIGGANALLHDGAGVTPQIKAGLTFQTENGINEYSFRLSHAAPDTLIFAEERYRHTPNDFSGTRTWIPLGAGHREANIVGNAERGDQTATVLLAVMRRCITYQFHNTSDTARIRQRWGVDDNHFLKEDGANLAPVLLRIRETRPKYYARITETLRQIAPFFADFILEPSGGTVLLQWRERNTDLIFGPHQASDGTLRAMALVSLLLQPEDELPLVMILDEPELGLHLMQLACSQACSRVFPGARRSSWLHNRWHFSITLNRSRLSLWIALIEHPPFSVSTLANSAIGWPNTPSRSSGRRTSSAGGLHDDPAPHGRRRPDRRDLRQSSPVASSRPVRCFSGCPMC